MKLFHVLSASFLILGLFPLAGGPARAEDFEVGQAVQFNFCDNGKPPTKWRSGVVTVLPRETAPGLVQMSVEETPSQDFPQGHGQWAPEPRCSRALTQANTAATEVKPLGWFLGKWNLAIIAPTRDFVGRDGRGYRREEWGARMGFVQINPDQTFTWKVFPSDPEAAWLRGRWRPAEANEPGARIVLLGGEDGRNWVVHGSSSGGKDELQLNDLQFGLQRLGSRG